MREHLDPIVLGDCDGEDASGELGPGLPVGLEQQPAAVALLASLPAAGRLLLHCWRSARRRRRVRRRRTCGCSSRRLRGPRSGGTGTCSGRRYLLRYDGSGLASLALQVRQAQRHGRALAYGALYRQLTAELGDRLAHEHEPERVDLAIQRLAVGEQLLDLLRGHAHAVVAHAQRHAVAFDDGTHAEPHPPCARSWHRRHS